MHHKQHQVTSFLKRKKEKSSMNYCHFHIGFITNPLPDKTYTWLTTRDTQIMSAIQHSSITDIDVVKWCWLWKRHLYGAHRDALVGLIKASACSYRFLTIFFLRICKLVMNTSCTWDLRLALNYNQSKQCLIGLIHDAFPLSATPSSRVT